MKRFTIILILYYIISINNIYSITISSENFGCYQLIAMDKFADKVVILGMESVVVDNKITNYPTIQYIENGVMTVLPNYIITDEGEVALELSPQSRIRFDDHGNLWFTGKSLYKYEDSKWKEFFISDKYSYARFYEHLAIDAEDNVWLTTSVFDKYNSSSINFSELYMFNGITFEKILQRTPYSIYSTYNTLINSEKLIRLKDGRIAFHKTLSRQGDEIIDSLDGELDLIIYEPGNTASEAHRIRTYDWDSLFNKIVNNMYIVDDKIWFAHQGNDIPVLDENFKFLYWITLHRGLSIFDIKSKDWRIFDEKDGFPFQSPNLPKPVMSITQLNDKLMLMVILSQPYLIHQDYQLEKTDWDLILSDATIYKSSEKVLDEDIYLAFDEAKKDKFYNAVLRPKIHKMFVTPDNNLWMLSNNFLIKAPIKMLSVSEQDLKEQAILLFPNPASDFIQINNPNTEISDIELTNLYGNLLLVFKGQTDKLNISDLPDGIYFLKVQLYNGSILYNRFVKCNW